MNTSTANKKTNANAIRAVRKVEVNLMSADRHVHKRSTAISIATPTNLLLSPAPSR